MQSKISNCFTYSLDKQFSNWQVNFRAAVLRILNMLRVSISKSKEKVFTSECLTRTVESLQQKVEQLSSETYNSDKVKSTMAGMNVYFLIQSILDQQVKDTCMQDYQTSNVSCALTTPETTHGKSKVRSLLTQFRYIVYFNYQKCTRSINCSVH